MRITFLRRADAPPQPRAPSGPARPCRRHRPAGCARLIQTLAALALLAAAPVAHAQSSFVITFDELPPQPVDGLSLQGVTFSFNNSGGATFSATGPGGLFFSDDAVLRGDATGVLVLDFARPTPTLSFAAALNNTNFAVSTGLTVELFGIGLVPLGTLPLAMVSQAAGLWIEGQFTYPGGPPITRAVIDFVEGNAGNPPEFLIDNLGFSTLPPARHRAPQDPQPFLLIDHPAIRSTNTSGLMMPAVHQQLLRNSARTALRDLNTRLYRARARHPARVATRRLEPAVATAQPLEFVLGKNPSHQIAAVQRDAGEPGEIPTASARTALEIFAAVDYGSINQSDLSRVFRGYDADTWAGSLGIEWRPNDWAAVGLAYSRVSTDARLDGGLGSANLDANLYSFYGTVFHGNTWLDLLYSYGDFSSELKRNTLVGDAGRADPGSGVHHLFINAGHQIPLDRRTVTGPMLGLDYISGHTGAYTETGSPRANLVYDRQNFDSLITRVGWQITRRQEVSWGVVELQGRLAWEKEHRPANDTIRATLANSPFILVTPGEGARRVGGYAASAPIASPGTDWITLGTGLRFGFRHDLALLLDYEGRFFQNNLSVHYGALKLSWEF